MNPYASVQGLLKNNLEGPKSIIGSCFRLEAPNYYITASHCIGDLRPEEIFVADVFSKDTDIPCITIQKHDRADLAILKVEDPIPQEYENFELLSSDNFCGTQIHCFGVITDWDGSPNNSPARVVGGIIQRDFEYKDGNYESLCFELSSSIPKGMSGGPAFLASEPNIAIGVAIASIRSEVVVSAFEEYENDKIKERERISEITRYGVILRLCKYKSWIENIIK